MNLYNKNFKKMLIYITKLLILLIKKLVQLKKILKNNMKEDLMNFNHNQITIKISYIIKIKK